MASCLLASVLLAGAAPGVQAQARFKVIGQSPVPQVGGLSIYTIRDEQLSSCYLLFAMEESPGAGSTAAVTTSPALPPAPSAAPDEVRPAPPTAKNWATKPWTTQTPGEPTGGWEHMAESMRLALVDPTTANALAAPVSTRLDELAERLGRIELLMREPGKSQRIAVLPVACTAERK